MGKISSNYLIIGGFLGILYGFHFYETPIKSQLLEKLIVLTPSLFLMIISIIMTIILYKSQSGTVLSNVDILLIFFLSASLTEFILAEYGIQLFTLICGGISLGISLGVRLRS